VIGAGISTTTTQASRKIHTGQPTTTLHGIVTGEMIALTCNEIRHLFTTLVTQLTDPLIWSRWRRQHQHRARTSHYRQELLLT
jgi:hypothetical protein